MTETRTCKNCRQEFVIEPDDFAFYEKIGVPPPTLCPECRKQRRLAWRNDMNLYPRPCDLCGKNILSIYSPESKLTVYCVKCWWSDKWDPYEYGRDYDFSRPFFEQFRELQQEVPIIALANDDGLISGSINCEYTQDFALAKNCYMVFVGWKMQDCMYSHYVLEGRGMVDCLGCWEECDYVYEGILAEKCYHSKYVYYSLALTDCAFCVDCRDCSNCFLSSGLRHKKHYFKNKQYSKEEYEKILQEYRLDTHRGVERAKKEFESILCAKPRRFATLRNSTRSEGEYLSNCKNCRDCFLIQRGEDCRYIDGADTPKDSYDLSTGGELSLAYEGITPDHTYLGRFGIFSWKNREYYYLDGCHSSERVFGCVGLKKGRYCILNKRYAKDEYEKMLPKIIEHMNAMPYVDKNGVTYKFGEFFPAELSYFGYNESVAQEHFPLTKEEAEARHFSWREKLSFTVGKETIGPEELPDPIKDVSDDITKETLVCMECKRNYRIVLQELQFYRQMNIPLPRRCFFCRHKARFRFRNPFSLWPRRCQCAGRKSENGVYSNTAEHFHGTGSCPNEFRTSFPPDRPEIVYCEQCYQAEVI